MFGRVIRIALGLARIASGFVLASLAAAVTLVLFVYAPADLASLRSDLSGERLSEAGLFALIVTPHVALYAALPALAGLIFAEVRRVAGWPFYALAGIATAAAGFLALHLSAAPDEAGLFSAYALAAFLTSGLIGGLAYWALSGRFVRPKGEPGFRDRVSGFKDDGRFGASRPDT